MSASGKLHVRVPMLFAAMLCCTSGGAGGQTGDGGDTSVGSLVLQSPVQAVASINETGAFLIVPGRDLCWNQIPAGTYRVLVSAGPQQWTQNAKINAGETTTLVAVLNDPGPPLSVFIPPPAPAPTITPSPAGKQPVQPSPPARTPATLQPAVPTPSPAPAITAPAPAVRQQKADQARKEAAQEAPKRAKEENKGTRRPRVL